MLVAVWWGFGRIAGATAFGLVTPASERVRCVRTGHFLRGVVRTQVLVWSEAADGWHHLRLYRAAGKDWQEVAAGVHTCITSLQVGDVDGDGRDDIVVGLRQRAKLDVRVRDRVHVYDVAVGRGFLPKWRGSALSRPFRKFTLLPACPRTGIKRAYLVALERGTGAVEIGYEWITVYVWNDFGFRVGWDTPVRGTVAGLATGCDAKGCYIQFAQIRASGPRQLRLRPVTGPLETGLTFRAEVR